MKSPEASQWDKPPYFVAALGNVKVIDVERAEQVAFVVVVRGVFDCCHWTNPPILPFAVR